MTTINPYLTFNGNCEAAFEFYRSAFGGEFGYIGRFKEMPTDPEHPVSEADLEKIMHIALSISEQTVLMGSDSLKAFGGDAVAGSNVSISINTASKEETDQLFNALSVDGMVKMPLNETFWGAYFGMFTDQFGIHWMINCELQQPAE